MTEVGPKNGTRPAIGKDHAEFAGCWLQVLSAAELLCCYAAFAIALAPLKPPITLWMRVRPFAAFAAAAVAMFASYWYSNVVRKQPIRGHALPLILGLPWTLMLWDLGFSLLLVVRLIAYGGLLLSLLLLVTTLSRQRSPECPES